MTPGLSVWQSVLEARWESYRLGFHALLGPKPSLHQRHNGFIARPLFGGQSANNHRRVRKFFGEWLLAGICVFCVLVFCITAAGAQTDVDEPTGLSTIPATETAMATTWEELQIEINNDLSIVDKCRETSQPCSSLALAEFMNIAKAGEGHQGLEKIGNLNRAANFAIRPLGISQPDVEWRSPLAILSRSKGDCKHFAVLKYALLRQSGVSPEDLKIIIVEIRSTHQLHAVVAVRAEKNRWLFLDNRTLIMVESSAALDRYDPLYEFDRKGVRQFASSWRSRQIAESVPSTRMP